ncbi:MAG TPA: hypothetical protein VF884_07100 [Nitrososphaeraceae archaeon]
MAFGYEKSNGTDTSGNIRGGSVSLSSYNLRGKKDNDHTPVTRGVSSVVGQ